MTITRRPLLFLPILAAAGCSVLPNRPYVETRRYPLSPRREGAPARAGRRVLMVRGMRAGPGMDVRGLRRLRADGTQVTDFYAEWVALPAEAAEDALRQWLVASRLFQAVVVQGTRARADLVLETELTLLQAEPERGTARAALSALLLADGPQGGTRVLAQIPLEGTAPLAGDGADAVAAACQAALGAAFAQLEAALARFA